MVNEKEKVVQEMLEKFPKDEQAENYLRISRLLEKSGYVAKTIMPSPDLTAVIPNTFSKTLKFA